jgi:glycosyltransferase involved in cell wall biosynthesis
MGRDMNKKDVTVIITQYHHEAYLPDAIQSIMDQSGQISTKTIIVNDDPNVYMLDYKDLCGHDINILLNNGYNIGQAASINRAIKLMDIQTEFVAFHDADDIMLPWRLRLQCDAMGLVKDMVYGDAVIINKYGERRYQFGHEWEPRLLATRTIAPFSSIMVRTELLKACPFREDIGYGNDRIWLINLSKLTKYIKYINLPMYYHREGTSTYQNHFNFNPVRKFENLFARIERNRKNRELNKMASELL